MKSSKSILFVVVKHTRSLGASEDLVVAAAEKLSKDGSAPAFWFNFRPADSDGRIQRLLAARCKVYFHDAHTPMLRVRRKLSRFADRAALESSLRSALKTTKPAIVVLNQGGNSDASVEASVLQRAGFPYSVLCHAATEASWPGPEFLPAMRSIFTGARNRFFVSESIWNITEAQLGIILDRTAVVYNPCKFSEIQSSPWPETTSGFSLAAASRIENKSKGIDLILRALALPQWRERPLSVTFYGEGPHRDSLESYAAALGLQSVHFAGQAEDVRAIWPRHHGFIQASRYEGYGLSLLEAMFCQRMAISTPIPAALEFVTEGETGFLARGSTVVEIADVLERAWSQRDRWREMGLAASTRVDNGYPENPAGDFLAMINRIF